MPCRIKPPGKLRKEVGLTTYPACNEEGSLFVTPLCAMGTEQSDKVNFTTGVSVSSTSSHAVSVTIPLLEATANLFTSIVIGITVRL
jgi:hypothetical protein